MRRLPGAMRRSFELGCFSNLLASGETCAMGRWELKLMLGFRKMTKCHLGLQLDMRLEGKNQCRVLGCMRCKSPRWLLKQARKKGWNNIWAQGSCLFARVLRVGAGLNLRAHTQSVSLQGPTDRRALVNIDKTRIARKAMPNKLQKIHCLWP